MSEQYNAALQARLRQYVAEAGNQAQAAANIGIGKTMISLYLNSNYGKDSTFGKGDLAGTEQKLAEFFRIQDARKAQPSQTSPSRIRPGHYVPTTVSEHVYKTIRYCQLEKGITMVHGDSGIGKTMAAAKYVRDNPTTAIYLEVSPTTGVLSRFIRLLAAELRIPDRRDQGYLVAEIKARLMGTNRVVIIDEAQNLKYTTMEEIRNWTTPHPITGVPGVGIVLIGNTQIHRRMIGGRKEDLYAQQFNRSRPRPYSRRQITRGDVQMIFPGLDVPGHEKETDFLLAVCQSKWAIRNATHIWNDAVNDEDISYAKLQGIAQSMGIGIA